MIVHLSYLTFIGYLLLGVGIGSLGTLIGVGGGFLLIPILLWLYPDQPAETIATISLAVIFFNALSGTIAYARMKRIDYRSGLLFAAAAFPGVILGALITTYIPRKTFDLIIGIVLMAAAIALLLRTRSDTPVAPKESNGARAVHLVDASGAVHQFSYHPWLGASLSTVVGFLSSMLGIGGGIVHVPLLVHLLNFPVHIATATSHFMLAIMAFGGSATHLIAGELQPGLILVLPLAIGALVGAQLGAKLSNRLRGAWIMRSLAVALLLVGLRLFWSVIG
jgi:uncharacterized membrane protein YfcA